MIPLQFTFTSDDTLLSYNCRFLAKIDPDKALISIAPAIETPQGSYCEGLIASRWVGDHLWAEPNAWPHHVNVLARDDGASSGFRIIDRGEIG